MQVARPIAPSGPRSKSSIPRCPGGIPEAGAAIQAAEYGLSVPALPLLPSQTTENILHNGLSLLPAVCELLSTGRTTPHLKRPGVIKSGQCSFQSTLTMMNEVSRGASTNESINSICPQARDLSRYL